MRVMIIDPWARTVKETEIANSDLQRIYENLTHEGEKMTDDFNVVQLAPKVMLYVNSEGFLKPDIPVWYIIGHGKHDELRPLCGMGILFGGVDAEGDDRSLPEYISEKFCQKAVTWSGQTSTGTLEPTVESPGLSRISDPILKGTKDV